MRALIVIAILALAGYLIYTNFYAPLSEEEQMIKDLEQRFHRSARAFTGSARMTSGSGIDMMDGAESAVRNIKKIKKEMDSVMRDLTEEKAIERAEKLKEEIQEFMRKNDIADN